MWQQFRHLLIFCVAACLFVATATAVRQTDHLDARDIFFQQVIFGAWFDGTMYFEIPVNADVLAAASSSASHQERWLPFFSRAIRDYSTHADDLTVDPAQIDLDYIQPATSYHPGDIIRFRTLSNGGTVALEKYQINCGGGQGCVLFDPNRGIRSRGQWRRRDLDRPFRI